jgi:ketosteroid isomerase-like protein
MTMLLRPIAFAAFIACFAAAAPPMAGPAKAGMAALAVSDQLPPAEADAVKTMFETATQALLDGDLDKWQTFWTEDATVMPPGQATVKGRAALVDYAAKNLVGKLDGFKQSNWRFEGCSDLAVVTTGMSWTSKDGKKIAAKQIVIAVKEPGGAWKAKTVIYNFDPAP